MRFAHVDEGRGVIMLTDLFGGTPSNLAICLLEAGRVEVIAGVNLPMLIRLEGARKSMERARRGDRRAGSRAEIYLGRLRNAGGRFVTAVSRNRRDHQPARAARAGQRQVRHLRRRLPETVSVEVEKDGSRVNGTSIMGLMMLGAAKGDTITIHTSGDGADAALLKLVGLVKDSFGED